MRSMLRLSRREFAGAVAGLTAGAAPSRRVAFVAGAKSHGFGEHAHSTGCLLLAKLLRQSGIDTVVHRNGWPANPSFFDGASTVVVYMDGGDRHPMLPYLESFDAVMKKGVGLVVLHYALVVPAGAPGAKFLDWIGGYYETNWSVNPFWTGKFDQLPRHPVTRGVKPFEIRDEWYYHMRFREGMRGVTPILTAIPPEETRMGPDGPHSGNPAVRARKGMAEHVAWAFERPGGGRGFGLTGAHAHWEWAHDDFRKLVLNAIVWTAGIEVPRAGFASPTPCREELMANQEGEAPEGFGPGGEIWRKLGIRDCAR